MGLSGGVHESVMLFPVLLCRCIVGTADGARKEGREGISHLCQVSPSTIPHSVGDALPTTCLDNLGGKAWKSFETGLSQVSIRRCDFNTKGSLINSTEAMLHPMPRCKLVRGRALPAQTGAPSPPPLARSSVLHPSSKTRKIRSVHSGWRLPARWSGARAGGRREWQSTWLPAKAWTGAELSQAHRREISFPSSSPHSRHSISGVGLGDPELSGASASPSLLHLHAF